MGLIQAFTGSLGGALADQWIEFLTVPVDIQPTAALFPAIAAGQEAGRGSNIRKSNCIITNGSKILVPEGYALLTLQNGALTSYVDQPGGYVWDSQSSESSSIFMGDSFAKSLINLSWQRFRYGGRPADAQAALFVCIKELPNNKFGTRSEIYWEDAYLNAQVGATARGVYSLIVEDPIQFAKQFVPAAYLQNGAVFDFTDLENPCSAQLFTEVVSSLSAAFSSYLNSADKQNRMMHIQQDVIGFAESLVESVEKNYQWRTKRGIKIQSAAVLAVEYDSATRELLKSVQRADALSGNRADLNLKASLAAGIEAAGQTEGAAGLLGIGMAANTIAGPGLQAQAPEKSSQEGRNIDMLGRLKQLKDAFEAGLITQAEYELAKQKELGI